MTALQPQAPAIRAGSSEEKLGQANVEAQRISDVADTGSGLLISFPTLATKTISSPFLLSDVSLRQPIMNSSLLTKAAGPARALAHRPLCRQAKIKECSAGFHSATLRVQSNERPSIQSPLKTPSTRRVCHEINMSCKAIADL